jgi:hypothetical protein
MLNARYALYVIHNHDHDSSIIMNRTCEMSVIHYYIIIAIVLSHTPATQNP